MKFKGLMLAGAAVIACGFFNTAEARSDRITMYEVQKFVEQYSDAVNSPNQDVMRSFLSMNVDNAASFKTNLTHPYANNGYWHPAWAGEYGSPYYRYPYAANHPYWQPSSSGTLHKDQMIAQMHHKKTVIPGFEQKVTMLGTHIPSNGDRAVVELRLQEFGMGYAPSPYDARYAHNVRHSVSNCYMHLEKQNDQVHMTRMTCSTTLN
ncbi:MAG: hypothetical protein JKY71_08160 [Alphaproteobacteria bacterium]|nr:hypothetical protein [Alphaproteobacteria bacterium]